MVTACAATGTSSRVAARIGATAFLPALFAQRYANMGHLDRGQFTRQIADCRSLTDEGWCAYWNAIADAHLQRAADTLADLTPPLSDAIRHVLQPEPPAPLDGLADLLAPYAPLLADHSLAPSPDAIAQYAREHPEAGSHRSAERIVDATLQLLHAITYLQVSAFPGGSPHRMRAYTRSRWLFDELAKGFSNGLGLVVEQFTIPAGTETVTGYRCLPDGDAPSPVVLVTNGLEGTVQELLVPLLRYHRTGLGVVVMEMPGSYAYRDRMSPASEAIYRDVIDAVAADPRVDAERIGMVGVSFGGYWAARMAAVDRRLVCAVACGAPTHHSFRFKLGLPEIIIDALAHVTGATTPGGLLRRLRALSLQGRYHEITQPLLVINGDADTLLSTRDSIELAAGAPRGELRLYAGDDHCAMGHYREWLDESQAWLGAHLLDAR